MLIAFTESGYLGDLLAASIAVRETILEFPEHTPIPEQLRSVATYL